MAAEMALAIKGAGGRVAEAYIPDAMGSRDVKEAP